MQLIRLLDELALQAKVTNLQEAAKYYEDHMRMERSNRAMMLEMLDIDYFKQYNDNYGHQKGDRCICMIADQLKRIAQYQGVSVYRYGGDEFVVIYEGLTRERVAEIAEELREHVWAEHVEHVYSKAADIVTISQGICWGYPAEGQAPADYLHAADEKLYEVKEQCRGGMLLADFCVQ